MTAPSLGDHSHLSIGEVLSLLQAEFPDVTISKIRFLESQGLLDPERTPSGYRKFYEDDIERLRWILTQQKENFLPLKVIKDRLAERDASMADAARGGAANDGGADATANGDGAGDAAHADGDADGSRGASVDGDDAAPVPASEAGGRPAPIWMADVARAAADRAREPSLFEQGTADAGGASPLDAGPSSVSLTFAELASASALEPEQLRELESYGLIEGRSVGNDQYFDGDALVIAQRSAAFIRHGIEPRHLRMFKIAAEREASFLEQVVMPMVKQRNPAARQQAAATLGELASLGQTLRGALLRNALHDYLG